MGCNRYLHSVLCLVPNYNNVLVKTRFRGYDTCPYRYGCPGDPFPGPRLKSPFLFNGGELGLALQLLARLDSSLCGLTQFARANSHLAHHGRSKRARALLYRPNRQSSTRAGFTASEMVVNFQSRERSGRTKRRFSVDRSPGVTEMSNNKIPSTALVDRSVRSSQAMRMNVALSRSPHDSCTSHVLMEHLTSFPPLSPNCELQNSIEV
jgi:hypothetical protein